MALVTPEAKVWITANVKTLIEETEDEKDACQYINDLTKECLEACDLSLDHEAPIHEELRQQIKAAFE